MLREFSVGAIAYTETWDDAELPPMGCGIVLVPWPNRVADGRWRHDGSDPAAGPHRAGPRKRHPWAAPEHRVAAPTVGEAGGGDAATSVYPQHGYPFTLDTAVEYALTDDGLRVTHRITNVGRWPAPFGVGTHPYLRVGDVPVGRPDADRGRRVDGDRRRAADPDRPGIGRRRPGSICGAQVGGIGSADAAFTDITAPTADRAPAAGPGRSRCAAVDGRGVRLECRSSPRRISRPPGVRTPGSRSRWSR